MFPVFSPAIIPSARPPGRVVCTRPQYLALSCLGGFSQARFSFPRLCLLNPTSPWPGCVKFSASLIWRVLEPSLSPPNPQTCDAAFLRALNYPALRFCVSHEMGRSWGQAVSQVTSIAPRTGQHRSPLPQMPERYLPIKYSRTHRTPVAT